MPRLVCRSCGKTVYTTAPFEQLFADERRCPRCGQLLFNDRRTDGSRRRTERRTSPATADSTPAAGNGATSAAAPEGARNGSSGDGATPTKAFVERRLGDRRKVKRRHDDQNPFQRPDDPGWTD